MMEMKEMQVKKEMEKSKENEVDVDEALDIGGPCGKFQFLTQAFFMYMVLTIGYQVVFTYFIASDPPWRCVGTPLSNTTTDTNETANTFCQDNPGLIVFSDSDHFYERCNLNRSEWEYTTSKSYSFVTEFDLVCEKATTAAFASSMFYIGGLFGSIVSGSVADAYGRKMVLITSLATTIMCR